MRTILSLTYGWQVSPCVLDENQRVPPKASDWIDVIVPHVTNLTDPSVLGPFLYRRTLELSDRNAFLDFGAVGGVCRAWLNGVYLGEHKGGYSRFRFSLDGPAHPGTNELLVLADNTMRQDWTPLSGDFNHPGGLYRPVDLVETGSTHFDLLYYGTSGLSIHPKTDGTVVTSARICGPTDDIDCVFRIFDGDEASPCAEVFCPAETPVAQMQIDSPHLWDGVHDPHIYRCEAQLVREKEILDAVSLPFGFRSIAIDRDQGFSLNGQHLLLRGVAKHQDRAEVGPATTEAQQKEDIDLICEMGANAVRLSHYQHPDATYDACDRAGLVVWAEIPMLAMPDGNEAVFQNAEQQLKELILQQCHHPSICFWGIQNEIAMFGESEEMYRKVEQLNQLVKSLDSTRLSTAANICGVGNTSPLNKITESAAWNLYFGWYYGGFDQYHDFLGAFRRENTVMPIGISEYGADCSVTLHSADPKAGDYSEEYQCLYHDSVYPIFAERSYIWGTFVWNMFDFGSARRSFADVKGLNCKGLVTYDRKIKKDAFFYYQSLWTQKPLVHLTGRRFKRRCGDTTTIKVYSNMPQVTLYLNGQQIASQSGQNVFEFKDVPLPQGESVYTAVAGTIRDEMTLVRVSQPEPSYIYVNPNPGFHVENWYSNEEGAEELFPADRYSIMDTVGELKANPEAWALLEEEIPAITGDPRIKGRTRHSLLRVINMRSGDYEEDAIKELNRKLNKIQKISQST